MIIDVGTPLSADFRHKPLEGSAAIPGVTGARTGLSTPVVTFYAWDDALLGKQTTPDGELLSPTIQNKGGKIPTTGKPSDHDKKGGKRGKLRFFNPKAVGVANFAEISAIESVSVQKTLNDPAGRFEIELSPYSTVSGDTQGMSWDHIIGDGCWVTIECLISTTTNETETVTVMHGKVDTVNTALVATDAGVSASCQISGRDIAAAPMDTPIYFNPYDDALKSNLAGRAMLEVLTDGEGATNALSGPPHVCVVKMLKAATSQGISYGFSPKVPPEYPNADKDGTWASLINWEKYVGKVRGQVFNPHILQPGNQNSVWQWTAAYQNPSMNEMFIDTDTKGQGYFAFRERPFVNLKDGKDSPWYKLNAYKIPMSLITQLSMNRGQNRINHVYIQGLYGSDNRQVMALTHPKVNVKSIEKHGLKRLEYNTPYYAENYSKWIEESQEWIALLCDWNALNAYYHQGNISLAKAAPGLKVGMKIELSEGPSPIVTMIPEKPYTLYVEGLQHNWSFNEGVSSSTVLTFSRGYIEEDRLKDLKAARKDWSDMGVTPAPASPPVPDPSDGTPSEATTLNGILLGSPSI